VNGSEIAAQGARIVAVIFRQHAGRMAWLFVGLLLPLWGFVELADEVHEQEAFFFDELLLLRAHASATPGLDQWFIGVSAAGYLYGVVPIDILLVLVLLWIRHWREASFAAASFAGSALLNLATKQFFRRDRPALWESLAPETTFSFPSGHAMGSMTLAMTVILLSWHTRWRWPVLLLALAFVLQVGASRIYLGVHYPSDILGGWLAGTAWAVGVYFMMFRWGARPWKRSGVADSGA
jgi:membrane-associated phospholipid phosphatase